MALIAGVSMPICGAWGAGTVTFLWASLLHGGDLLTYLDPMGPDSGRCTHHRPDGIGS
jgi:hypothetical protein